MPKLSEAPTVKNQVKGLVRAAKEALKDKTLPKGVHDALEALSKALGKTWTDLEADSASEPREAALFEHPDLPLTESATVGIWCESRIHSMFTTMADDMYGQGYLTRDERKALSHAIGLALDAFTVSVETDAPQLYDRSPYENAPAETDASGMMEGGRQGAQKDTAAQEVVSNIEYESAYVPLIEKAVRADGTVPVKIIQPGWGSSGYYSPEVLQKAAENKVFKAGTKMYLDHPTPTEESERPERSVKDLAAELVSNATWQPSHISGPGLYADAKVFKPFSEAVDELAPHIGVSIRALGRAEPGQAEGKQGAIITEITSARSVDLVTEPGAGGRIVSMLEARRSAAHTVQTTEVDTMDEKQEKALIEANAQLKLSLEKLQEKDLLRDAGDYAAQKLADVELHEVTKARLKGSLVKTAPIKDGKLDLVAFDAQIAEAVKQEAAYLTEVTGGGRITGMGSTQPADPKPEELTKSLEESFKAIGLSDSAAKAAARGRD